MVKIFDEIIISSCGNKGYLLIGCLNELSMNYPIQKINYFTGTSGGSIICLLLNLGYSIDEMTDILMKINFGDFQDFKLLNLIENCGLDDGNKFSNLIKAIIINKGYNNNITFLELYNISKKNLTIVTVNITTGLTEYHNYINTPSMSILLSIRMSMNIPLVFSPILYNNNFYIDGALLEPFPYYYHKSTKKIGFWLFDESEINFLKNYEFEFINKLPDSLTYMFNLIKILHVNYIKKYYKKIPKDVIYINYNLKNISFENFNVSNTDKFKMFNIGIKKCKLYFNKIYKKNRIKYLEVKYFKLWKMRIKQ
jgi:NTE family protein